MHAGVVGGVQAGVVGGVQAGVVGCVQAGVVCMQVWCACRCGVHVGGVQVVCRCASVQVRVSRVFMVFRVQTHTTRTHNSTHNTTQNHTQHTTTPQHKALPAFAWPK